MTLDAEGLVFLADDFDETPDRFKEISIWLHPGYLQVFYKNSIHKVRSSLFTLLSNYGIICKKTEDR